MNGGDIGLKYNFIATPMIRPYVMAGVGIAAVSTEVEFAVNGTVIDPATRGVQLGSDLSGSTNRTLLVFGFGVKVPFKDRFFADLGYRFGHISSKDTDTETLASIPTQRIVLGVGIKFYGGLDLASMTVAHCATCHQRRVTWFVEFSLRPRSSPAPAPTRSPPQSGSISFSPTANGPAAPSPSTAISTKT